MTTLRYALAPIALLIVLVAAKAKEAYDEDWAMRGAVRLVAVFDCDGVCRDPGLRSAGRDSG